MFLTIIKVLHETGCALASTLFNVFFDAVVRLVINGYHPGTYLSLSYLLDADRVGNRSKLTSEVPVSDMEYADDMALISDSCDAITTLLESLDSKCPCMRLLSTVRTANFLLSCQMLMPNPHPTSSWVQRAIPLK